MRLQGQLPLWGILCSMLVAQVCAQAGAALKLENLRAAADYSIKRRGLSMLVMQNDEVIFEQYANGNSRGKRLKIYSGTKGFWALGALVAIDERLLSLDERVAETITEWRSDPRKSRITMRQLLNFTDGLEPQFFLHGDSVPDRNAVAIRAPLVAAPGSVFLYGPSHLQVFDEVLRRKLAGRRQTPAGYLQQKVLDPLGLRGMEFKRDAKGNPLLASGFRLTAREWARMGTLILHHGAYGGRQIVRGDLLEQCWQGSAANPSFGIGFWNNREARRPTARESDIEEMLELKWPRQHWSGVCICKNAPPEMVASVGSGYQRLFVIPSENVVIVRQGIDARFSDANFLNLLLGR